MEKFSIFPFKEQTDIFLQGQLSVIKRLIFETTMHLNKKVKLLAFKFGTTGDGTRSEQLKFT